MISLGTLRRLSLFLALTIGGCNCGGPGDMDPDTGTGEVDGGDGGNTDVDGGDGGNTDEDAGDGSTDPDTGTGCLTACDPDHCGAVDDGCQGIITCPSCDGVGEVCGLNAPSRCGVPMGMCTPVSAESVCAGVCGQRSNGCDGIYECDGTNGGLTCDAATQRCGFDPLVPAEYGQCVNLQTCVPTTCGAIGKQCGQHSNGCDNVPLDCTVATGGCTNGQVCGTGANDGVCVDPVNTCTPLTQAQACSATCGIVGDGCGNQITCPACPLNETCGGGGTPGVCGSGQTSCTPFDIAVVCAGKCGLVSDGCEGTYTCSDMNTGETCDANAGESCGGGGVPNECGAPPCTPISMATACPTVGGHPSCGSVGNGCGELIACGNCPGTEVCGLNVPNLCANLPVCQPIAVATACAGKCGTVPDGCGGTYTCSGANGGVTCTLPAFCGANVPNTCGTPPVTCTPQTCASLGHTCGLAGDGCGGALNCWPNGTSACPDPTTQACVAGAGGVQTCQTGTGGCTGPLCNNLPQGCSMASPTRLTGTVVTPGIVSGGSTINQIPVPNALIYIPGDPATGLPAIPTGVTVGSAASCGRCADEQLVAAGQTVLASAVTNSLGAFTLEGRIPVGVAFNIVIKVGKWRRVVQVANNVVSSCNSVALPTSTTRLSASSTDGLAGTQIPKIAISTGSVDEMECVFRNMGISESEFTLPTGTGRIHMYRGNGAQMTGATCLGNTTWGSGNTPHACSDSRYGQVNYGCYDGRAGCAWSNDEAPLFQTNGRARSYDMLVFDCQGDDADHLDAEDDRIVEYVLNGGRMFASHWEYRWIIDNTEFSSSAAWNGSTTADSDTAFLSLVTGGQANRPRANPIKSIQLREWMNFQGALTSNAPPTLTITDARDLAGATVGASTDEWVYRYEGSNNTNPQVQQLSFNTPYGAAEANICGRVAYSGFHVSGADNNDANDFFPGTCANAVLSPQEKILAFMLFDLNACASAGDPPTPPSCTPATAAMLCPTVNSACGLVSDGCGGLVDCAGCSAGNYCNGTTCTPQVCTPVTCNALGYNCGSAPDGCGGTLSCGVCSGTQVCGLGGPGLCGSSSCSPIPLATACPANSCGLVSDGCGGTYNCGMCPSGQVCGGNGPNRCGAGSCTTIPLNVACMGRNCGLVSDGCGGTHNCGMCNLPDSCGGGGVNNVCGHPICTPETMQMACAGRNCGWASDGCGGAINCGTCPNGAACGGGGPGVCGAACTPTTCAAENAECGAISNECNGIIQCGVCPQGETCGADGPNRCGAATCMPRDCAAAMAECGQVGDGCGGILDCGVCIAPESCGGAGIPNQCDPGMGGCTPMTCGAMNIACGAASDGCGGLLDCGGCGANQFCSGGECISIE